ncbi:MAG: hypothetical protein ACTSSE_08585 [Candidatus Thorarchaeota archaeon]
MPTKEGFIETYKQVTGKSLTKKTAAKELADNLNKHKPLKRMFFELFPKMEETAEDVACAGMSNLFG